jgi:hypothetical protein
MGTIDMQIIVYPGSFVYIASSGDWRLHVAEGSFRIMPQVGELEYSSGINLDNLAALIVSAKAHATANGISWSGN